MTATSEQDGRKTEYRDGRWVYQDDGAPVVCVSGTSEPRKEMPKYKCHKEVRALKIAAMEVQQDGSVRIQPHDAGYDVFTVSAEYWAKHKPEVGGYYVVYEDGYESYSPAKAFEDGYSPIC